MGNLFTEGINLIMVYCRFTCTTSENGSNPRELKSHWLHSSPSMCIWLTLKEHVDNMRDSHISPSMKLYSELNCECVLKKKSINITVNADTAMVGAGEGPWI